MTFRMPVFVGDLVSVHCAVTRVGRTSITVLVEAWARRGRTCEEVKVTEGRFTYVAIDGQGRPRVVPREGTAEPPPEPALAQAPK
jgi:acyl-CoA thioesterase YciA